jgi:hypothetical protein
MAQLSHVACCEESSTAARSDGNTHHAHCSACRAVAAQAGTSIADKRSR